MKDIVYILNFGWGNLQAFRMFLIKIGYNADIVDISEDSLKDDFFKDTVCIIPGIGTGSSFSLLTKEFKDLIALKLGSAKAVIGICLGAHFMCERTSEGHGDGLGIFNLEAKKIDGGFNIGYRSVSLFGEHYSIYHCHGYYLPVSAKTLSIGVGTKDFEYSQLMYHKNLCLIQGHPEKSGIDGENLMKKVLEKC